MLPFIAGDLVLLAVAWCNVAFFANPLSPLPFITITVFVVLGVAALMIPFIVNDSRAKEKAADALRQEMSEQFKRLIATSEHLQHATAQLKNIEEASAKSVKAAEQLPYRLQEKIADFNQQLTETAAKEKAMIEQEQTRLRSEETERLSKVASQIAQSLTEWAKIGTEVRQQLTETVAREKELFEQQLAKSRTTETDRLAAGADGVTKALAGWVRIELDARQQLAAAAEIQERIAGLLAVVDSRVAGLKAAVDDAVKAAETIRTAPPAPAITLPVTPMPGTDSPIVASPAPIEPAVEPTTPTLAEATPSTELPPVVVPDWRSFLEPLAPVSEPAPGGTGVLPVGLSALQPEGIGGTPIPSGTGVPPVSLGTPQQETVAVPPIPSGTGSLPAVSSSEALAKEEASGEGRVSPVGLGTPQPEDIGGTPIPSGTGVPPVSLGTPQQETVVAPPIPSGTGVSPVGSGAPQPEDIGGTPIPSSDSVSPVIASPALPGVAIQPDGLAARPDLSESTPTPLPSPSLSPSPPLSLSPSLSPATSSADESESLTAPSDASVPPKPRKPRAPRKPKTEGSAAGESATGSESGSESPIVPPPPVELISEPVADEPPAPENFSQVPPEENKPAANRSADGRTRLTVISYIGIGNKLHIRGEGPGLSPTKGVPLQFVSIGRWRWETDKATEPVVCRIYKNDRLEAPTGPLTLAPGTEQEVSAQF